MDSAHKYLVLVLFVCLVGNGVATPLQSPDVSQALQVHIRHRRDLHSITRNLINELVVNLQQSSAAAVQSIANFTVALGQEKQQFVERLLQDIDNLRTAVQQAVDDAKTNALNIGYGVYECIENERGTAEEIFTDAVAQVTGCVSERVEQFTDQLHELAELSSGASAAADEALGKAQGCGEEGNVFAVGACLTGVLVETQIASATIGGRVAMLITRITLSVDSLPVTLPVCASARLAETALRVASLVLQIGQCATTAAEA